MSDTRMNRSSGDFFLFRALPYKGCMKIVDVSSVAKFWSWELFLWDTLLSKIIFSEKSLSVHMHVSLSICPVPSPSPQKATESVNFAKQSCQTYYKGDKNTSRVMLQCWAR